jgi:uncharacterized protein YkwD
VRTTPLRALATRALPATAAVVAAGLLACEVPAAAQGGCANGNAPATRLAAADLRAAVVCLANEQRAARGLPPLRQSGKLDQSAQRWTDAMVARGSFDHGRVGARVSAAGLNWSTVGENIATGFETPREVVGAWMTSAGHCHNILDPIYADVGIGVSPAFIHGYANRPGTWTQDFALPSGHRAPSRDWGPANGCPY